MTQSKAFPLIKATLLSILIVFSGVDVSYAQQNVKSKKVSTIPSKVDGQQSALDTSQLPFDISILSSKYSSWGVNPNNTRSSINVVSAWRRYKKKKEITVAVIDTGIDPLHTFLKKNIITSSGKVSASNFGLDFSKDRVNANKPSDNHGHGTHVSAIVKSVYPDVKILTLKYYNPKASGQDNLDSTIQALKYAVDNNVDIINYSGGGPEPALQELKILKEAEKKGIIVVAAAGNEQSNIDIKSNAYYPASYGLKNIISVAAHDKNLNILSSSNWGRNSVDIAAPGYRIRSAFPNGRAGYLTGTSQGTAFVTGVAALLKSAHPKLSAEEIREIIKASARKVKSLTTKVASGGRLDATRSLILAQKYLKAKKLKRSLANRNRRKNGKIQYRLNKKKQITN